METDKRYFIEGLFIIGFAVATALFAVWLANSGDRDDVIYRIHFAESVSGLSLGDPVKFHGVDVGKVKTMALDPANPRLVQVDVRLRKDTPVKTDTKASLRLKGITGVVYVELDGGSPAAPSLAAATPEGQVPEIPYEKSSIATLEEQLPSVLKKFSALEDKAGKVISDVSGVTSQIKEILPSCCADPRKSRQTSGPSRERPPRPLPRPAPTDAAARTRPTGMPPYKRTTDLLINGPGMRPLHCTYPMRQWRLTCATVHRRLADASSASASRSGCRWPRRRSPRRS